jgi:hypothetical protein
MKFPDFVVCGIQKGGTTSLYRYLGLHPSIFLSEKKELNFFHLHYDLGIDWYVNHFSACRSCEIAGEVSPLYMWHPIVPSRMASTIPNARLIFCLRDPVERAFSNYWFNISRGTQNPTQSFSSAIRCEDGIKRYVSKGFYSDSIRRFLRFYDRSKMIFVLTENLQRNPKSEMKMCFEFLGLNPSVEVDHDFSLRHNVTVLPRNQLTSRMLGMGARVRRILTDPSLATARRYVPEFLHSFAGTLNAAFDRVCLGNQSRGQVEEDDRQYLREIYALRNQDLPEIVNERLGSWK